MKPVPNKASSPRVEVGILTRATLDLILSFKIY